MSKGIDYAFSPHPSAAALKAAGVTFACRYVSAYAPNDGNGKNILAAEKNALLAAGISVVLVAEEGANRMLGGKAAGVADAQHADAVAKALGMPGIPVYFACDWDASPNDQVAVNAYLDGVASVIGRSRTGIYGGYYVVKRALDAGKAVYAWQTIAWSGGQWDTRAQLRQGSGVTLGGASCDWDTSQAADFGQWPSPGGHPTLVLGQAGPAVAELQARLNAWGAKLTADGSFGPATLAALRAFQGAHRLTVDGVAGPGSWAALLAAPPVLGPSSPKGLVVTSVSVSLAWQPIQVGGKPAASYSVRAVGTNGQAYASTSSATTSATLSGLTHGWTYDVLVSAVGGQDAEITLTV